MTPKEKAEDLLKKMLFEIEHNCQDSLTKMVAKECAIITCNEVLGYMGADRGYEFWTLVKQEIKNL
jgi:hypothetical protein